MDKTVAVVLRGLITALAFATAPALAQTTAGTSATIVVPIIAQTGSFGSEATAYNPRRPSARRSPSACHFSVFANSSLIQADFGHSQSQFVTNASR